MSAPCSCHDGRELRHVVLHACGGLVVREQDALVAAIAIFSKPPREREGIERVARRRFERIDVNAVRLRDRDQPAAENAHGSSQHGVSRRKCRRDRGLQGSRPRRAQQQNIRAAAAEDRCQLFVDPFCQRRKLRPAVVDERLAHCRQHLLGHGNGAGNEQQILFHGPVLTRKPCARPRNILGGACTSGSEAPAMELERVRLTALSTCAG